MLYFTATSSFMPSVSILSYAVQHDRILLICVILFLSWKMDINVTPDYTEDIVSLLMTSCFGKRNVPMVI